MKVRLPCTRNRLRRSGAWLSVCLFVLFSALSAAHGDTSTFTLQSARGRVEIQAGGKGAWKPVKRGAQSAAVGDRIRTGPDGSVRIVTGDGSRVALGPKTEVVLREPEKPRGWRVILGRLFASITNAPGLEVRAPAAVAAAEGTTFQLDVSEDGTTVLTVVEGAVRFFNDAGAVNVLTSQQSTAQVGQAPSRPIVVDAKSLTAWEANLQTMTIGLEYPQVSTDPKQLDEELARRQTTLQQRPDDATAHTALAEVLLDLGRVDDALAQAQEAVRLAPDDAAAHGVLGYALLKAGRPSEAQQEFDFASKAQPDSARWQIGLALVALNQRDLKPAISLVRRAAELAPQDAYPRAYLTAAYLRAGDLEDAAASASEAIHLGPENSLAHAYLAYVHLAQGRVDEAVADGRAAVEEAPQSALAREALGYALFFADDFPAARAELELAVDLNPLSAGSHLALAKLMAAQNEVEPALHEAQLAVGLDPQSAPAHSTLGLLFLVHNDPRRAGHQFQAALTVDPSLSEAHTGWGQVLLRRGSFREALEQQKAAVSLDTGSASAQNNLGGVYASLGEMSLAIKHLQRAIELQPNWGMPYANLALVYLEQNRFVDALDAGERALQLGYSSPFVHTVLARIFERQGRTDRALAELRDAVALDERYPQARFQLAQLYLQGDRARDAVREILTSVTMDPSAMLELRRYARTENTLSGGSFDRIHYDARHSSPALDGRLSYFASGLVDDTGGFRAVNQDQAERFGEVIVGHQAQPSTQLAFFGTVLRSAAGVPGPVTPASLGDPDDRQNFAGYDAIVAYRQRLSQAVTGTLKYSFRHEQSRFRNPDSLTAGDPDPFAELINESSQHSPEFRIDASISETSSVAAGYSRLWDQERLHGLVGMSDPVTSATTFNPFGVRATPKTDTAWLEAQSRITDRFNLLVGEYWGRQSGVSGVWLPKVVALYRPDRSTWWSLVANPIFRTDALELAPVEALAEPFGLSYLNFTEGGAGRTYEVRYQRQGRRSSTITAALAYQRVRGLLIDIEDPALTGLPTRLLVERGHRWIADTSYEQWLTSTVTGRAWLRWQSSEGRFPTVAVDGTDWPYIPEWQAGSRLDYIDRSGLRVGLEGIWVGRRFADPQNLRRVASHPLFNLGVQYQRNLHENYFINVLNLAGRDYETFAGFPQAGRTVVAGIDYRF
jgi:tetratricopeptide (TPR) repeat protein